MAFNLKVGICKMPCVYLEDIVCGIMEHLYVCLKFCMPPSRHLCQTAGNLSYILSASTQHDFFALFSLLQVLQATSALGAICIHPSKSCCALCSGFSTHRSTLLERWHGFESWPGTYFFLFWWGGGGGHLKACSLSITQSMQFLFCGSQICVFINLL